MIQTRLARFGIESRVDLSVLTCSERRAYVAVRMNGIRLREHARATDRSPRTVADLLRSAERKLGERR